MCNCPLNSFLKSQPAASEILKGAYVKLYDNGDLYLKLKGSRCGTPSCSSHVSTVDQYRCDEMKYDLLYGMGEDVQENKKDPHYAIMHWRDDGNFGIGTMIDDETDSMVEPAPEPPKKYTWFQFERFTSRFPYCLCHCTTYLLYECCNVNYGPEGESHHVECKPLVIDIV